MIDRLNMSIQPVTPIEAAYNRSSIFDIIEATNINEAHLPELLGLINETDAVLISLDGDGVLFHRYDEQGRLQDDRKEWTDPHLSGELSVLGLALESLRKTCEENGKILITAMDTNRETDVVQRIFAHFPQSIRGSYLASCEGGHVLHTITEDEIHSHSQPDLHPQLQQLKNQIEHDLDEELAKKSKPMGNDAYKPPREGMITFRGVDPQFVGWDPEAKKVTGPLLNILEKYHYSDASPFQVAYYEFDGGLDIYFPEFSKQTGVTGIIDMAIDQKLIKPNQKILVIHFGDSHPDEISGEGVAKNSSQYKIIDLAVANGKIGLRRKANIATNSNALWGAYEGVRIIENMVANKPFQEKSVIAYKTLRAVLLSYLAPEKPTEADFNLLGALREIDLNMIKHLIETIKQVQATEGRIFCIGNGGSYDNSKLLAYLLNNAGISNAQTPGSGNDKAMIAMRFGQDQIFSQILERENLSDKDMLITVSGSGNSPNILEAIKLAQSKGSKVFGLGGRDGGEMARMAGRKECLIAKTNIMEVIEDIHASAAFIAGQLISEPELNSQTLIRVHNKALETIALMASEKNLEGYAEIIYKIEKSMMTGGRIIFVGDTNIGVSHIRADLGRGATNQFPFKLRVPENIGSSNSFSATGNDDGPDFTWYHALQNIGLQPNDLVVILNSPLKEGDQAMSLCNDLATTAGCETLIIGCDLPEMSATVKLDLPLPQFEFATAIMADLLGRTLNEHLKHSLNMEIKPLALDKIPPAISSWYQEKIGRNKKLSRIDTLEFERKLKEVEILPEGKVITFCYGQIFITDDPVNYGLRRDY